MGLRQQLKRSAFLRRVNAAVKGPLQHWQATRSQWVYTARAALLDAPTPAGPALQAALRARLAARRLGRAARRKGEMHVFLAYGLTNWERILPRALAPFGRVTEFELRGRGFDATSTDWVQRREAMNRAMLAAFEQADREQPVDAFVGYLSGRDTAPETLSACAARGAAVFNFCLDDKLAFPGPRLGGRFASPAAIAHAVDLNLTNAPGSISKYAVHGGLATFFPEAAHPDVHRPFPVSFDIDVSFVGANYGWRPRFIRSLERLGVRVECFGRGWPNGPLDDEAMIRLYSRSRINLGFGGIGFSRRLMCLKGRDFEVPMSGGLYLTQYNPELSLVFDLGSEIVTYRDEHECAAKVRDLLAHPDRSQGIREAGRRRCLRDHTYETRWGAVFSLAGLLVPDDSGRRADLQAPT